jgi:hypothetical protein
MVQQVKELHRSLSCNVRRVSKDSRVIRARRVSRVRSVTSVSSVSRTSRATELAERHTCNMRVLSTLLDCTLPVLERC